MVQGTMFLSRSENKTISSENEKSVVAARKFAESLAVAESMSVKQQMLIEQGSTPILQDAAAGNDVNIEALTKEYGQFSDAVSVDVITHLNAEILKMERSPHLQKDVFWQYVADYALQFGAIYSLTNLFSIKRHDKQFYRPFEDGFISSSDVKVSSAKTKVFDRIRKAPSIIPSKTVIDGHVYLPQFFKSVPQNRRTAGVVAPPFPMPTMSQQLLQAGDTDTLGVTAFELKFAIAGPLDPTFAAALAVENFSGKTTGMLLEHQILLLVQKDLKDGVRSKLVEHIKKELFSDQLGIKALTLDERYKVYLLSLAFSRFSPKVQSGIKLKFTGYFSKVTERINKCESFEGISTLIEEIDFVKSCFKEYDSKITVSEGGALTELAKEFYTPIAQEQYKKTQVSYSKKAVEIFLDNYKSMNVETLGKCRKELRSYVANAFWGLGGELLDTFFSKAGVTANWKELKFFNGEADSAFSSSDAKVKFAAAKLFSRFFVSYSMIAKLKTTDFSTKTFDNLAKDFSTTGMFMSALKNMGVVLSNSEGADQVKKPYAEAVSAWFSELNEGLEKKVNLIIKDSKSSYGFLSTIFELKKAPGNSTESDSDSGTFPGGLIKLKLDLLKAITTSLQQKDAVQFGFDLDKIYADIYTGNQGLRTALKSCIDTFEGKRLKKILETSWAKVLEGNWDDKAVSQILKKLSIEFRDSVSGEKALTSDQLQQVLAKLSAYLKGKSFKGIGSFPKEECVYILTHYILDADTNKTRITIELKKKAEDVLALSLSAGEQKETKALTSWFDQIKYFSDINGQVLPAFNKAREGSADADWCEGMLSQWQDLSACQRISHLSDLKSLVGKLECWLLKPSTKKVEKRELNANLTTSHNKLIVKVAAAKVIAKLGDLGFQDDKYFQDAAIHRKLFGRSYSIKGLDKIEGNLYKLAIFTAKHARYIKKLENALNKRDMLSIASRFEGVPEFLKPAVLGEINLLVPISEQTDETSTKEDNIKISKWTLKTGTWGYSTGAGSIENSYAKGGVNFEQRTVRPAKGSSIISYQDLKITEKSSVGTITSEIKQAAAMVLFSQMREFYDKGTLSAQAERYTIGSHQQYDLKFWCCEGMNDFICKAARIALICFSPLKQSLDLKLGSDVDMHGCLKFPEKAQPFQKADAELINCLGDDLTIILKAWNETCESKTTQNRNSFIDRRIKHAEDLLETKVRNNQPPGPPH